MGRYKSHTTTTSLAGKTRTQQIIELLKRERVDVIRHVLDDRYTGHELLLCRRDGSIDYRMVAIPNGGHINDHMELWIAYRDNSCLVSDSITSILRWIGVGS